MVLQHQDLKFIRIQTLKNQLAYAVSKAGVIQLTKWFSSYLDKKFSINTISFGGLSDKYMKKNFQTKLFKTYS